MCTVALSEVEIAEALVGKQPFERFELEQNVPNPFNPTTEIGYRKSEIGPTQLTIYDLLGREVAVLVDGVVAAGRHSVRFDGTGLASGVYIYRLESGGKVETRKMVLLSWLMDFTAIELARSAATFRSALRGICRLCK